MQISLEGNLGTLILLWHYVKLVFQQFHLKYQLIWSIGSKDIKLFVFMFSHANTLSMKTDGNFCYTYNLKLECRILDIFFAMDKTIILVVSAKISAYLVKELKALSTSNGLFNPINIFVKKQRFSISYLMAILLFLFF